LEVLRIDGKGVGKGLVDGIAKSARPNLKDITLETSSSLGGASIIKGLSTAPNLERISLGYLSEELLASLAAMLSAARGGGTPLLRSLYQTSVYPEKLSLLAFARIGLWLPELTDLRVGFGLKERDYSYYPGFGVHEVRWPLSIAPFATLRRPNLYRMISFSGGHLTSAELKRLLQLVLAQCPRLEALALTHSPSVLNRGFRLRDPDFGLASGFQMLRHHSLCFIWQSRAESPRHASTGRASAVSRTQRKCASSRSRRR
jgi:hypothetical protein